MGETVCLRGIHVPSLYEYWASAGFDDGRHFICERTVPVGSAVGLLAAPPAHNYRIINMCTRAPLFQELVCVVWNRPSPGFQLSVIHCQALA